MYRIKLEKNVMKFLEKHKWEKIIDIFWEKLNIISKNPYHNSLDIKALQWLKNQYRLRIGKYRFLYEVSDNNEIIFFFDANNRWNIYK